MQRKSDTCRTFPISTNANEVNSYQSNRQNCKLSVFLSRTLEKDVLFNPCNSDFFASTRKCRRKIGFSQFASAKGYFCGSKKMPTENRIFSIFASKMVI